jgi:hypothetical protein
VVRERYHRAMGMLGAGVVIAIALVVLAPSARADDAPLVNLLTSVPSTIAVSSTVDNVRIRPEHIADGKLETAWNSATGQILGAWVEVRVPAGTQIKQIKLTPGFSVVDKKQGDLFTKNARIKKLRLYHGGRPIKDVTLDATRRDLQTIEVDLAGGDFRLEVIAAEPGSKKTWREASISELEVWGTLPAGTTAAAKKLKPAVRLGSLDALPVLSKADCRTSVLIAGARIPGSTITLDQQIAVSPDVTICRFDRKVADALDVTVDIAAVGRRTRKILGTAVTETIQRGEEPEDSVSQNMGPTEHSDRVELRLVPLTASEAALLVEVITDQSAWYSDGGTTKSTLYRVLATGLADIASWTSHRGKHVEGGSSDECELVIPTVGTKLPRRLQLSCKSTDEDWHNEDLDLRGMNDKSRTDYLKWNGSRYENP